MGFHNAIDFRVPIRLPLGPPVIVPLLLNTIYCITLNFRGRKISRKVNFKYFREKIFSRIYCSRENIFPRKYLPAKISSRENILSRKYLPAKISSRENMFPRFFPCRKFSRLVGLGYAVIGDTGSRPNVRS